MDTGSPISEAGCLGARGLIIYIDPSVKKVLMGTPNREPQEYNRNIMKYKDPGKYIPTIFLGFPVWGSQ